MHWYVSRPIAAFLWSCLAVAGPSQAQTVSSLGQAVEAAWTLSPQARSLASRQNELDARSRAASSLFAGPPSLLLSHRTDRLGSNGGLREDEIEVSAPVWTPAVRRSTSEQVDADRAALAGQYALAKLKLAAEVRELAAQAAAARIERDIAQGKLREAQLLAADVERRVKAGDAARVDSLQAQSTQRQSGAGHALAEGALARALSQWRALTGLASVASLDEAPGSPQDHPAVLSAQAQLRAAQARLALAQADRREPMEVGVGMTRERPASGFASDNSLRLALRIPLGSASRNASKLAAAQAEVDEADAQALAAVRAIEAERDAVRSDLDAARRAESLAADRERGSREVQDLIAKSYRLGESDLPTRLRADNERFEAELAHAKARLETQRATARLNQAYGILP
ncbi:TolC family protein [uncultured Ramlibacter sp.]|uniref:TolC family protein n=1 Tax=uncultured Ramlibacter sp. TaxID=260755 RepID=UPI0026092F8E|nr:TolC family protein [uncultured Ramlibacter sp.]